MFKRFSFFPKSIFDPIERILENFVLEGDHAFLVLPPILRGVFARGHGGHFHLHAKRLEFLAKNPAGAARVKAVRGNDDPFDVVGLRPVADGDGLVASVGDDVRRD